MMNRWLSSTRPTACRTSVRIVAYWALRSSSGTRITPSRPPRPVRRARPHARRFMSRNIWDRTLACLCSIEPARLCRVEEAGHLRGRLRPVETLGLEEATATKFLAKTAIRDHPMESVRQCDRVVGIHQDRGVACHLRDRGHPGRDDRRATGHRLQHGEPEA